MASFKFLVVLALVFICVSLANSSPFNRPWEQTDSVNPSDETDVKEPEQYGGGYNTDKCRYGCCFRYRGSNSCLRCCRYPNEQTNTVESQKRGRGGCKYGCCGGYAYGQCSACCSRSQVAEKANEQEAFPVGTQGQP